MKEHVDNILKNNENVILDWILLPHTHYFKMCDIKILVNSKTENIRKEKVIERDKISEVELELRDSAAIKYNENQFDFVIKNNYTLEV
jgi:dephospho-CoA kinase